MIAKMGERGQIPGCIIDGPLSLDLAVSEGAVKIKKVTSQVAGDADCLLFPGIEAANVFYKTNTQLIPGVKIAAYVVGAMAPCVLSSRADSMETKLNSIAFAVNNCK
jgi:phosphate butyryltransferase